MSLLRRLANGCRSVVFFLLSPLRQVLRLIPVKTLVDDPASSARRFIDAFAASNEGLQHPPFLATSYRDALSRAQREAAFLVIYLHSGRHADTPRYCKDTLCSPAVVQLLSGPRCIVWGGDVTFCAEAYQVSGRVRNSTHPYVACILPQTPRPLLVASVSGAASVDTLVQTLSAAFDDHGAALVAARAEAEERTQIRRIREEQDAALEASIAADRRIEASKAEQIASAARAQADAAALAAAAQAEAAAQAAAAEEAARAAARRRAAKLASLSPEPAIGGPAITVSVRLPGGGRLQRRFLDETPTVRMKIRAATSTDFLLHFSGNGVRLGWRNERRSWRCRWRRRSIPPCYARAAHRFTSRWDNTQRN